MNCIYTTHTALLTIKKAAKKSVKQSNKTLKLSIALDAVAREHGYDDFRHANECFKRTPNDILKDTPALPTEYKTWAKAMCEQIVVSEATQALFSNGFLFGFNDKDADTECDPAIFVECPDAVSLIFDDMARDRLFLEDEESQIKHIDNYSIEDNQEYIIDDMNRLRYFVPSPDSAPRNIPELKGFLKDNVFFYPEIIWFKKRLVWQRFVDSGNDILK